MRRCAFMTSSLSATAPAALVQLLIRDVGRSRDSKPRTLIRHLAPPSTRSAGGLPIAVGF